MFKSCQKRHGIQSWACYSDDGSICSRKKTESPNHPNHKGGRPPNAKLPSTETLRELLLTMTYEQIAKLYGCSRHTVSERVRSAGLSGISPHGHKKLASTVHHVRVEDEFDPVKCSWARRPMGKPFGGPGWHAVGTLFAMRAGE
jgi:hypothetical protein